MATDTAGAPHRPQPRADMVDLEEDDTGVESVATGVPCPLSTSIWRSLATISSGVCLFLRGIGWSSSSAKAETWDGPLHGGQASAAGRHPTLAFPASPVTFSQE